MTTGRGGGVGAGETDPVSHEEEDGAGDNGMFGTAVEDMENDRRGNDKGEKECG